MMTISSRGKPYKRELKVLASNVRWRTGRGPATGQGQAIAPTMDALDQPIRQDQPLGKDKPLPLLWTPLTSRFVSLVGAMACPRPASMDALDQPIRQLSRGDGLSSPSFASRFILLISGMFLMLVVLLLFSSLPAHADGGAPNLAYVVGTPKGITTIDIGQQKVTGTIAVDGDPHSVFLSLDGRFLYVTQPASGRVTMLAARTGQTICTANVPGQPTLLAFDTTPGANVFYAAGNGASSVSVIDSSNCNIKRTFTTGGPVYGLAVANVGSGSVSSQIWVANPTSLNIFDPTGKQLGSIPVPGGPQYISIPPGTTVYVTTRQGGVDAVDLGTHQVFSLLTGGTFGPMDYDAITGDVYVPDQRNKRLDVLTPLSSGETSLPPEPNRKFDLGVAPQSVAITSDGQLGFIALKGGNVAMLDVPGRQIVDTIYVGGSPHFIITGLYPPLVGTTPQQASIWGTVINIAAYVFVVALLIVPILLFRRYSRATPASKDKMHQ